MRTWKRDTMMVAFSSSKAIGALIIAILVTRGYLNYEDKVIKYWPEFGAHGKENVTVQWILEHKAGLSLFDGDFSIEQARDHQFMSRLIENTKPKWPPGTAIKYHAITYGWLLDQLVRRSDPKKRSIGQFYREEIQTQMTEKDYYIGSPRQQYHRVARIVQPTITDKIKTITTNYAFAMLTLKVIIGGKCELCDTANYPPWMTAVTEKMPYNNPEVQEVENAAATGIGTARGFANVIATIWKKKMISDEIWERISKPVTAPDDKMSDLALHRGYGFFHEQHPILENSYALYHGGHGMQMLIFDPHSKVVLALLRNGLLWDTHENEKIKSIFGKIIEIVEKKS